MIKIDIVIAMSFFLCFFVCIVFALWIFYNYTDDKTLPEEEDVRIQQCPICTHLLSVWKPEDVIICPKCKSYFQNENMGGKKC